MFHNLSLDDAIDAGGLRTRGDRTRTDAFLRQFTLPELRAEKKSVA